MTVRAIADHKFIRRYLLIACGGLAFMLWGLYDCLITSPSRLEMAEAYAELSDLDSTSQSKRWFEIAEERGWPRAQPDTPGEVQQYIWFNWLVAGAGFLLCLVFLIKYMRTKNAWMEATDKGINTSWGQSLEFDKISKINKTKWEKKGIAKVSYEGPSGTRDTMVFDDFKFERAPMSELMSLAEQGVSQDKIIGGRTEAEIALQREEEEQKKKAAKAAEFDDED